jgi:signal transduction histidine kinase
MAAVFSRGRGHWPAEAEESLKGFAGLVGVSVVNARQRAELTASRIRLVEAADTTRRRIERDLHERIQQRLVTVGLELRAAERTVPPGTDGLRERISGAARHVTEIIESLQDIARGLHPAFLLRGGLEPSLRALARRSALPVELEFHGERPLSPTVAITLYHVASEALANAAQHGHASAVRIRLDQDDRVRLRVDDDGVGGARPYPGSALVHLRDRTEALGGELVIESPPGSGTSIRVTMPAEPPPHA